VVMTTAPIAGISFLNITIMMLSGWQGALH